MTTVKVDLIWLVDPATPHAQPPFWSLGRAYSVAAQPQPVAQWVQEYSSDGHMSPFCLFWDARLGLPDAQIIEVTTRLPGDGWHAGLCLGLGEQPGLLDFVVFTWMFNRDPEPNQVATSWRLSLRACLVKSDLLLACGGPESDFTSLTGASLALGLRWLRQGAFLRHVPTLLPPSINLDAESFPLVDQFLLLQRQYGRGWSTWALGRALLTGYAGRIPLIRAFREARQKGMGPKWVRRWMRPRPPTPTELTPWHNTVSVLIPTLERYPYLFRLLDQLRRQTVRPRQIIVIDQTSLANRQPDWPQQFSDLPLHVIWRDEAGQCSSRNAGLMMADGEMILFLDDDIEIEPDLIATHLAFLAHYQVDVSCGVVEEAGVGAVAEEVTFVQASSVFPAGNALLRREVLNASGLFDLAYEKGARADADLGMRLYLAGKLLAINPFAQILHLHAPKGGLRQHKARAITKASSRASLSQRVIISATEGYLWHRYFSSRQLREAVLIRSVASLRTLDPQRRWLRFLLMLVYLPFTYRDNWRGLQAGYKLKQNHPTIPVLTVTSDHG